MKVMLSVAALAVLMSTCAYAATQSVSSSSTTTTTTSHAPPANADGDFAAHKAKMIEHLNTHIAELQKALACAGAANTPEALHACMPPPPPRGEPMDGGPAGGPQGGPPPAGRPGQGSGTPQ